MNVIEELEKKATAIEERARAIIDEASDPANHYPRGRRYTAQVSGRMVTRAEASLQKAAGIREAVALLRSGPTVYVVRLARVGYNHLGSNVNGVHWAEDSAKREAALYPEDAWEATIEPHQVEER